MDGPEGGRKDDDGPDDTYNDANFDEVFIHSAHSCAPRSSSYNGRREFLFCSVWAFDGFQRLSAKNAGNELVEKIFY